MTGNRPHQKKKIPTIVSVTPVDDQRLSIEFGSGSLLDLNMQHRMRTTRHYDLNNPAVFRAAVTDGSIIIFDPNSVFVPDIFPREAVNMALRPLTHDAISFLRVQPLENSRIRLEMATGSVLVMNMENHIRTSRYSDLKDEELFRSVRADRESLIFGDALQGDVLRIDEDELTRLMLSVPTAEEDENE